MKRTNCKVYVLCLAIVLVLSILLFCLVACANDSNQTVPTDPPTDPDSPTDTKPSEDDDANEDLSFTLLADDTYSLSTANKDVVTVKIPNTYNDKPVTSIAECAFKNCIELTNVTVPNSVTKIGKGAFEGCVKLKELAIPFVGATNYISEHAHFGYIFGAESYEHNSEFVPSTLKKVSVTSGNYIDNTLSLHIINSYAFFGCNNLETINIPSDIKHIGQRALYGCTSLQYNIYDNAEYLGNDENKFVALIKSKDKSVASCNIHENVNLIFHSAFEDCYDLESIVIPNNTWEIGFNAFKGCSGLTDIVIPYGIEAIPKNAFDGCNNIISANIPTYLIEYLPKTNMQSVIITGEGENMTESAFEGCANLISVNLQNKMLTVPDRAFYGCINLANINVPSSVRSIGTSAFEGCIKLSNITLQNGIEHINNRAFYGCAQLMDIQIPDSVKSIGLNVLAGCANLKEIVIPFVGASVGITDKDKRHEPLGYLFDTAQYDGSTATEQVYYGTIDYEARTDTYYLPSSLEKVTVEGGYIPLGSFMNCLALKEVIIADNVIGVNGLAFVNCPGLRYNVYDNAKYLGNANNTYVALIEATDKSITSCDIHQNTKFILSAFHECINLSQIYIPSSVTSIGEQSFLECPNLESIVVENGNTKYKSKNNCLIETASKTLLLGCKNSIIPDDGSVTRIGDYAFVSCAITNLTIPYGITDIGNFAFTACYLLAKVTIPSTVTSIGYKVFSYCDNLAIITVENGNTKYYSKNNCLIEKANKTLIAGCKNSVIPDDGSVTQIAEFAFEGCGITDITIPASIINIDANAFIFCNQLTSITVLCSANSFANFAFSGCENITSATISAEMIGHIPDYMLQNLQTIVITSGQIKNYAFSDCTQLTSVTLLDGVYAGFDAFSGCNNITYASMSAEDLQNIPTDNLQTIVVTKGKIPNYMFEYCTDLTSITLQNGVTDIGIGAFVGCGITNLSLPGSVTKIGKNAFTLCPNLESIAVARNNTHYLSSNNCLIETASKTLILGCKNSVISDNGSITQIADYTFAGCDISDITIPNSVTYIGENVFEGCENVTSLSISAEMIKYIPNCVLQSLRTVLITSGVIPEGAFATYCENLTDIILQNGVTCIGAHAFQECLSLTKITIPSSVTSIGYEAFALCVQLEEIIVESDNPNYCNSGNCLIETSTKTLIAGCKNSVIPDDGSITHIADYAFAGCSISDITIPNTVTSIGDGAFAYCQLTSIVIPDNVSTVGESVFSLSTIKTVYCKAESKPEGWNDRWIDNCEAEVVWNYKG